MTYIIAEIGQNHDGDQKLAKRLVQSAIASGVDAVKMQYLTADGLVDKKLPTMSHSSTHATMWERFKSLELHWDVFEWAKDECSAHGVDFIISPFDMKAFEACADLADKVKIASGELTNPMAISQAAVCGKDVIVSTGMATTPEVVDAVEKLDPWALLHCVSLYPTPANLAQLWRITDLQQLYPSIQVGYSDHCRGIEVACVARSMGALVIEKHFTLTPDRVLGDHGHSVDVSGMRMLVDRCLRIEEAIGCEDERPDMGMRKWLRRRPDGLRGVA